MGLFHLLLSFLIVLLRMVGGIEQACSMSNTDDYCIHFDILSGKELKAVMVTVRSTPIYSQ